MTERTLIAPTKRKAMTKARRVRIFLDHDGRCCLCEQKIRDGERWIVEHLNALALGGAESAENCAPAHERCRRVKDKADAKAIAKRNRIVDAGYAGKKSRFRTARNGRFKQKMDGTVVDRATGLPIGRER